ncbi:MAG: T9SS type A sorting domain-containing protein [candidate division Zixibacteria bacterium]|nr:T9SS type A sorting domain-containing protein [candidate division Zixibacteria bacterium]
MRWLNFGINSVGDPALDLYTENPITMYPSYEKLIDITQESFEIYDVPDDALVCIWKGDEVYDYDVATSGTVTFANTALTTGTMFVTVTAHNYRPEIGCIGVYGTEPYVAFDSLNINDASGNNDGFVDCGEDIMMGVNMTNPGQNDAQNVEVIISTTDPYIVITDATHTFGTIPGNGEAYEADAFSFSVAGDTPENHLIRFEVRAEGDNFENCGSHIKIETHAPAIVSVYPPVMSEILAIGGSEENELTISNTGMGTLDFTAVATVDGDDEWLTIDTEEGSIPPFGRDVIIDVTMDAADLTVGIYTGQVLIESNDPDNPTTVVPCTLSVVTTGIEDGTASLLPTSYSLSQNYPNPFNPVTTFKYALPIDSDVKLEVFNVYGQEVETLIDERQSAGYKTVTWNAADYSSGIYFYKLSAGNKTFTKRMTLMK